MYEAIKPASIVHEMVHCIIPTALEWLKIMTKEQQLYSANDKNFNKDNAQEHTKHVHYIHKDRDKYNHFIDIFYM